MKVLLLYSVLLFNFKHKTIATFTNDTAILDVENDHDEANKKIEKSINQIKTRTKIW